MSLALCSAWVLTCCPLHCMLPSWIQGVRGFPGPDMMHADLCTAGGVGTVHVAPVMCGVVIWVAAVLDSTFKRAHVTAGQSRFCWCLRHPMVSSGSPRRGCRASAAPWWGVLFSHLGRIQETYLPGAVSEPQSRPENGEQILLAVCGRAPSFLCMGVPQNHSGRRDRFRWREEPRSRQPGPNVRVSFQFLFLSEVLQWRAQTTPDHVLYTLLNCRVRPLCGALATPAWRFPASCPVTPTSGPLPLLRQTQQTRLGECFH